ncbi:hypothetical protein [Vibrio pelagius]|uniref:hypothetical protein n=1 Tax=Vibrio pelagius TaxID=28169 RepID=UPI0021C33E30|nr:hypothetical protein [Vibrio pelagius]
MKKTFKNVSSESGEITVQFNQAKLSFHVESGAEFTLESSERTDVVFSSTSPDVNLVIEPV